MSGEITEQKKSGRYLKYNVWWQPLIHPALVEMDCIRMGGRWKKKNGEMAGEGLEFHFRRLMQILWPELLWESNGYKNYWAEECLKAYVSTQWLGVLGCAAAGKSAFFGAIALADWYCRPHDTTVMVTSTDLKALELRIWGMIKKYHKNAVQRCPWLPGHIIEGKQMLLADSRDEAEEGRDFKAGIVAIATKKGSQYVGIGCFVAGTPVDTPNGQVPIESIKPGDVVMSAIGPRKVRATQSRISDKLVSVKLKDGRELITTVEHPFFTNRGWIKAVDLSSEHYILSPDETLQILQQEVPGSESATLLLAGVQKEIKEQGMSDMQAGVLSTGCSRHVLQQALLNEVEDVGQELCGADCRQERFGGGRQEGEGILPPAPRGATQGRRESSFASRGSSVSDSEAKLGEATAAEPESVWRERQRPSTDSTGSGSVEAVPGSHLQPLDPNSACIPQEQGVVLHEAGPELAECEAGGGSGRRDAYAPTADHQRPTQGQEAAGAWVDRVTVCERSSVEQHRAGSGGYIVHNLEVEGHPSYCVSGLVCHNSWVGVHSPRIRMIADELALMNRAFLDSASNLSKCPDFKLVGIGNPSETTNAHGILCEPHPDIGGWEGGIDQEPKTKTWKTRFPNGMALQLPGSDSPNMQAGPDEEPPFPFLMTRKQMEDDAAIWGKDDWRFSMMNDAKMPRGQGSRRVITRQMCVKFGAFEPPNFRDTRRRSIAFLDAAYRGSGGDRCVFGELQFGPEVVPQDNTMNISALADGTWHNDRFRNIIALIDLVVIPISGEPGADSPEDQIVGFVMKECNKRGIPASDFFYDAGMRTSLVTAFSRLWSPEVESIDFGGKPSDEYVSAEINKKCSEYYNKFVTELWFNVRLAIESGQFRGMTEELCREFSMREWKMTSNNRIEVETKAEMKVKSGRSPDLADAVAAGVYGARKRGFIITKMSDLRPQNPKELRWKEDLKRRAYKTHRSGALNYAA